jgi:hypothetical protein
MRPLGSNQELWLLKVLKNTYLAPYDARQKVPQSLIRRGLLVRYDGTQEKPPTAIYWRNDYILTPLGEELARAARVKAALCEKK